MKKLAGLTLIGALGLAACGPVKEPVREAYMNGSQGVNIYASGVPVQFRDECNGTQNRWSEQRDPMPNNPLPSDGVVDSIWIRGDMGYSRSLVFFDPNCPSAVEWSEEVGRRGTPIPPQIQAAASKAMQAVREFEYVSALNDFNVSRAQK